MPPQAIRVAAVDDHPVMLRGVQAAAAEAGGSVRFVAMARTVRELLALDRTVDVALLDLRLKDSSRPRDNVMALRGAGMKVLLYTEGDRTTWIADALRAGARGVVTKAQDEAELLAAIRAVHAGHRVVTPELAAVVGQHSGLRPQLAPREGQALLHVAHGLADKQVARVMGISEDTVKEYLKRIRAKYAEVGRPATSRIELRLRAEEDGILFGPTPPAAPEEHGTPPV